MISILMAVSGVWPAASAVAQVVSESSNETASVFQTAPSDVRKLLMRAERATTERRYADAAYELGRLLMIEDAELAESQDYFLVEADSEQAPGQLSLKGRIQQMLAELPAEGRQAYELQFGAQARAQLAEALSEGNMDKLADVIRRFMHTQAGYEAAILAGRYELACGRPTAAALHFGRVAGTPTAAARFEPELSFLLATCWLYAEMPEKARQVLVAMRGRAGGDSIQLGDKTVALFRNESEALTWFDGLVGERQPLVSPEVTQWVLHRGNPQRNGRAQGSLPLLSYRWRVPTCIDRADEKLVEKLGKQYRDEGRAAVPALQPLAVGDTILMRTPHKLLGVDFASGKRVWVWPPWENDAIEPWSAGGTGEQVLSAQREQEVHQRIWDDAAHGQVSSDGQSAFLVHDLGFAAAGMYAPNRMIVVQGGIAMRYPGAARTTNQLVSLSLARQGAAQWIVGGDSGEDEPKLAGAFFLGPPLPLRGNLYVMAEFNGEIRLVVLDAKHGRLIWQQQLAHVDARNIAIDGTRRLAGAMPSHEGGVLICPTSAGAVVAVDVAARTLLWGYQYLKMPQQPQHAGFGIIQVARRNPQPLGSRWIDSTVTVADSRVLITPAETDDFHCLDLLTGKPVWEPQPRGERLYVACVHQGKIVCVGPEQVTAIRVSDGQPAWANPVALTDPPSGRGFYSDHYYYLPTAGAELLKIDLDSGQIATRSTTSIVLGNLVCYRDEILSHGPDWLSTFYQSEPLRQRVEATLAQRPDDLDALARYGELLLAQGKRDEAIETLRTVCRQSPNNETARSLLADTLLAALQDDFPGRLDTVDEIRRLVEHPSQNVRLLRLLASGWQAQGDFQKAFDAYLGLAGLKDESRVEPQVYEQEVEEIERHWNCRTERWLQARFGELLTAADASQRATIESTIGQWREAALGAGDIASLRRFLRYFDAHPSADGIRLRLAERLVETGEFTEAELLLSSLEQRTDESLRREATGLLAHLLEKGRQYDDALTQFRALADRWGDAECREGKTGRQLFEEAMRRAEFKEAVARTEPWPSGHVEVGEAAEQVNRYPSYRRVYSCLTQQRSFAAPPGMRAFYDQHPNTLIIRDGYGNTVQTINLGQRRLNTADFSLTHARFHGHLMLVSMGMELLAVDLIQAARNPSAPVRWRKELVRPAPGATIYQTNINVQALKHPWGDSRRVFADKDRNLVGVTGPITHRGFFYMNLRELICADPVSGETIWSRTNMPVGSDVFGDDELIFVVPPSSRQAQVFRSVDGQDLGTREIDELDYRWATLGRNVLAWSQASATDPLTLRLYDAWTGEEIWREEVPADTRATLIEDDEVAMLQSDGRFFVRSLRHDGVPVWDQVKAEEGLLSLYVLRSQDQYLLVTNRAAKVEPNTPAATIRSIVSGTAAPLVTGRVYAFDRRSGQSAWREPAEVDRYGFPTDQPSESPVLLFLRHYRPQADRAGQQQHTAALAIGRNDGRLIMERGDIPAQTYTYDVTADRLKQTVTIGLPAKVITMTLTDKPAPEKTEPPADDAETEKPAETTEAPPAAGAMQAVPAPAPAVAPFRAPPVPADPFGPAAPQAVPVPPGQDPFGR
ncbi:MAG: PQQ-binding-like beta-propeller repeat protein [Pirellulaceae bacterium]|nr:PQQ-binding-like beta-propeller repeat protein [Pirellulaceae bacterium]